MVKKINVQNQIANISSLKHCGLPLDGMYNAY